MDEHPGPEQPKEQAGLSLSSFALQERNEPACRVDNGELLNALPSLSIDRKTSLEALWGSRAER